MESIAQSPVKKSYTYYLLILLFYILSLVIFIVVSGTTKELPVEYKDLTTVAASSGLTFILVIIFTKWSKLTPNMVGILPGKLTLKRFFTGISIGLMAAIFQLLISLLFFHDHLTLSLNSLNTKAIILNILLYFFVALREEFVFRSYPLNALNNSLKSTISLFIIIIVFIAEHILAGMSWKMAIIGSGFGGLLFGIAALRTKGLALPIGLHFAWNLGQWITGFKNGTGIYKVIVEAGYEQKAENIGLVAFVFVMCIAIALVIFLTKSQNISQRSTL